MATETANRKIYEPETIEETPLPEAVIWEEIVGAPTTLAELDPTAQADIDAAIAAMADSVQGWMLDSTFSASDNDTVAWAAGTLTFNNGTAYSISAGNTGNISAINYIYFDPAVSTTTLQVTNNPANAVGTNKLLIGVCQNVAAGKKAIFQVFGGKGGMGVLLTADNIAANSITANEIQTNTITTLNLTAGSISGMTITGGTVRTSSSSTRVEMSSADNALTIYYGGDARVILDGYQLTFLGPYEVGGGAIFSAGTNQIDINVGGGIDYEFNEGGFYPMYSGLDLGGSGSNAWQDLYAVGTSYLTTISGTTLTMTGTSQLTGKLKIPVGTNLY